MQYYDDFVEGPLKPNSPAPGRWFEPVAITPNESAAAINILMEVWLETGDGRFVEPFADVADWYERSRLDDGSWARFYEIGTNRPLYCTPDRVITYSDEDLRPGYDWKGRWGEGALRTISQVQTLDREGILAEREAVPNEEGVRRLARDAREALDALDHRNLWVVERGPEEANIRTDEFNRRMAQLCAYLEAVGRVGD